MGEPPVDAQVGPATPDTPVPATPDTPVPATSEVPDGGLPEAPPAAPAVPASRAGRAWVTIALGLLLLAVLLVFVFQNLHDTSIHFFTASGTIPVALALVLAAIAGAVVVLLVGSVRIVQLRRHVRASYAKGLAHGRHRSGPEAGRD